MPAWVARPRAMSCGTRRFTVSTGTAKPIPAQAPLGLKIAAVTPLSRPPGAGEGAAEFPRVEPRFGLDDVADASAARRPELAAERRHDAGGQRVVEPERVADGEHALTAQERAGRPRRKLHEP